MKDVEGNKPETLKDCWRWVRGLLHDFVNLKKSFNDYQRIFKKVELLLNVNYNSAQHGHNDYSIMMQNKENSINPNYAMSSYNVKTSLSMNPSELCTARELSMLEKAIDMKLSNFRK